MITEQAAAAGVGVVLLVGAIAAGYIIQYCVDKKTSIVEIISGTA